MKKIRGNGQIGRVVSSSFRDPRVARQIPPITDSTIAAWGHVLAFEITVSGPIPEGETTANVTYFIVDKARDAIVGNLTLPNASTFSRSFRMNVRVPQLSDSFDVGTYSEAGEFQSAGFTVEAPKAPAGAVGPQS